MIWQVFQMLWRFLDGDSMVTYTLNKAKHGRISYYDIPFAATNKHHKLADIGGKVPTVRVLGGA